MSLPENLRKQILTQFDELIAEGDAIKAAMVCEAPRNGLVPPLYQFDIGRMREWLTRCVSLLDHAIPKSSIHTAWIEELSKTQASSQAPQIVIPKLRALRKDFDSGLFDSMVQRLESAIAADYMSQADELLNEGGRGVHDHVPAAVLAGATLENWMRSKCGEQNPPIEAVLPNGKKKMLNVLIDDLKNAGHYNESRAKQLRAWAAIRNHAAHGEFNQFTRSEVENMLAGIKSFFEDFN